MVTFCAIIMFSKPFANLSSNDSSFNDEVSTVADGRVSSEECFRPTRVMSVTEEIWLQSQSLLRSHWLLLHWNDLIDHICSYSINDDLIDGVLAVSFCFRKWYRETVSAVYRHIIETKGQFMKLKKIHCLMLLLPLYAWMVK